MNNQFTTFELEYLANGVVLWLNQPQKRNVISSLMIKELNVFLTQISHNIQFLILAGRGECFAAGADIKEIASINETQAREISTKLHQLHHNMANFDALIIAAVHGYAIGGGFELAMGADMIFADESAWFQLPEIAYQLIPGGGATQLLPKIIGRRNALHIILTGKKITAKEGAQMGFVQEVDETNKVVEKTIEKVENIIKKSGKEAVITLKQAIRNAETKEGFEAESEGFAWLLVNKAKPFLKKFINKK